MKPGSFTALNMEKMTEQGREGRETKCNNMGQGSKHSLCTQGPRSLSQARPCPTYFAGETPAHSNGGTHPSIGRVLSRKGFCVCARESEGDQETHMQSLERHKCTHTHSHKGLLSRQAEGLLCQVTGKML